MTDQPTGGGELTQFEAASAVTPKKMALAIVIGAALIVPLLWLLSALAPTEAVEELKAAEKEAKEAPAEAQPVGGSVDDI